jgi:transposase
VIRAYKFLLRPTARQTVALGEMLRDHCSLYNGALQERRDAYRHTSKTSVRYGDQSAQLKEIRAFDPERQGRWSFSSQQATLRRLDKAFQAFFRRVKAGQTLGYPKAADAALSSLSSWCRREHNRGGLRTQPRKDLCRRQRGVGRRAWRLCQDGCHP